MIWPETIDRLQLEARRQDRSWGENRVNHPMTWVTVITEETGEVARAALEHDLEHMRTELVQVAAVALHAAQGLTLLQAGRPVTDQDPASPPAGPGLLEAIAVTLCRNDPNRDYDQTLAQLWTGHERTP